MRQNQEPLTPFLLACFALAPQARATCQEGCLTNNNTVLGDDALLNTTGTDNTAIGYQALHNNTTGINNTANGQNALRSNTTGSGNIALGHGAGANLTIGDYNIDLGNRGLRVSLKQFASAYRRYTARHISLA